MSQRKRGRSRDATSWRTCCSTEALNSAVSSGTSLCPGLKWISNGVLNNASKSLCCGNRTCLSTMGRRLKASELYYVQCGEELLQTFWMRCLSPRGTHASDAFCSLYLRARIERITKLYACFHPGCTARGYRNAKGAASMDAAAKACRRLHGAHGALSLQRSTTSILLNGPDHASHHRCTWPTVSASKLDQAARSAPPMFHVRWCHVCLHFIHRRVVVRIHTGFSVQVSRLSVLGWICGSVHRTGRRAFASTSLCAAPHVLCQRPGTGHASVFALVKLTCLRAIVRIVADALRLARLSTLKTASSFGGSQAPGCQVSGPIHPHGPTGGPSFAPLLSSPCSCNEALCLLLQELQLPAPTAHRHSPHNTSRQTS